MTSAVAVSARARGRSIEVKARKLVGPATAHEAGESRERAGVYRFHYRESVEISTRPRLGIFPRRQRLQGTDRFRSSADWVAASRGAAAAEVSDARMSATSDKYGNFAGAHLKWMFRTVKARTKMGSAYRRPAATLD